MTGGLGRGRTEDAQKAIDKYEKSYYDGDVDFFTNRGFVQDRHAHEADRQGDLCPFGISGRVSLLHVSGPPSVGFKLSRTEVLML